jgi:hypothetical protein
MIPQTQTRLVRVTEFRQEERTREVPYVVMVPKQIERQFTEIVYRPVTEDRVVSYMEMVPQTIERTTQVPETRMVAREITYEVPGGTIER